MIFAWLQRIFGGTPSVASAKPRTTPPPPAPPTAHPAPPAQSPIRHPSSAATPPHYQQTNKRTPNLSPGRTIKPTHIGVHQTDGH